MNLRILIIILLFAACKEPEARRPVQGATDTFLEESVARNRALLEAETNRIRQIIALDSLKEYKNTGSGSWFTYINRNETTSPLPKTDDVVTLTYTLTTLDNDTLYTTEDIGIIDYKVDRQELFPGLRNGIKLLKENETATFLFPSSLAYGYHGDQDKVGVNVPVKCTVSIFKIERTND